MLYLVDTQCSSAMELSADNFLWDCYASGEKIVFISFKREVASPPLTLKTTKPKKVETTFAQRIWKGEYVRPYELNIISLQFATVLLQGKNPLLFYFSLIYLIRLFR